MNCAEDTGQSGKLFEDKMRRLEEIVALLESPNLSLEDAMQLYKEGMVCSRYCRDRLEKARHELEIWRNGEAEDFDPDSSQPGPEEEI